MTECFEIEGDLGLLQELFGGGGMSPHAAALVEAGEASGGALQP